MPAAMAVRNIGWTWIGPSARTEIWPSTWPGKPSVLAIVRAFSWKRVSASLVSLASAAARVEAGERLQRLVESEKVSAESFTSGCSVPTSALIALKSRLSSVMSARIRQPVIWLPRS